MQRTVKGVEVYEVGKRQLWEWCDWMGCGDWHNVRVYNYADSLRKGAYVVVEGSARFGRFARPSVVRSCGSLRDAVEIANTLVEFEQSRTYGRYRNITSVAAHEYEIWHIVDDCELWGEWELDAQESLQCHECGARLNDDNMVCYDVDLVCEKCHDKRLDATIESTSQNPMDELISAAHRERIEREYCADDTQDSDGVGYQHVVLDASEGITETGLYMEVMQALNKIPIEKRGDCYSVVDLYGYDEDGDECMTWFQFDQAAAAVMFIMSAVTSAEVTHAVHWLVCGGTEPVDRWEVRQHVETF